MKKPTHLLAASLILSVMSLPVQAAIYNWDGDTTTADAQDGGGIWNTTNTNWITPGTTGTNVAWASSNTATFGISTDGTYAVSVQLDPTVASLAFNYSGYTLNANIARIISTGATPVTIAAGKSATIGNNLTVRGPDGSSSTISGGGTLIIDSGGTVRNYGTNGSHTLSINASTVEVKTGGSLTTRQTVPTTAEGVTTGNAIFVNGPLNVTGGTVNSFGTLGIGQTTGTTAGTLTISTGRVTANSVSGLRFGSTTSAYGGTVNLDGGTLSALKIFKGATTVTESTVNFNGGTLKKEVISADVFLGGIGRANVRNGGANIDITTNATITQPLEHSAIEGDAAIDGGLTKLGLGALTLSGVSNYTGATLVNVGTLLVDGAIAGSASLDVAADATLGGVGTIAPDITVNSGGVLAPGNSTGTLSASGAVTLAGKLDIQLDGAAADRLNALGALDISQATLRISTLAGGAIQPVYVIAQFGSLNGTQFVVVEGLPSGYSVQYDLSNKQIKLVAATPAGFSSWISGSGFVNGAIPLDKQGPNADPDNDGVSNLVEYAIAGMDPTVSNPAAGTYSGNTLSFAKRQPLAADLTYAIEESTDLGNGDPWTEVPAGPSYVNDTTTISHLLPGAAAKNFMRLKVTSNP